MRAAKAWAFRMLRAGALKLFTLCYVNILSLQSSPVALERCCCIVHPLPDLKIPWKSSAHLQITRKVLESYFEQRGRTLFNSNFSKLPWKTPILKESKTWNKKYRNSRNTKFSKRRTNTGNSYWSGWQGFYHFNYSDQHSKILTAAIINSVMVTTKNRSFSFFKI